MFEQQAAHARLPGVGQCGRGCLIVGVLQRRAEQCALLRRGGYRPEIEADRNTRAGIGALKHDRFALALAGIAQQTAASMAPAEAMKPVFGGRAGQQGQHLTDHTGDAFVAWRRHAHRYPAALGWNPGVQSGQRCTAGQESAGDRRA